jgi:hypothetical protein
MHVIRMILTLALSISSTHGMATFVPDTDEVVQANLKGDGDASFQDGYVKLNKTTGTISLWLQPVMPACPAGDSCPEVMPEPMDYFLEGVKARVDECGAVIYQAEQNRAHSIRVILFDNTQYNYERCPSFLPVPETVVQVEQIFYGPNSTEEKSGYLAAEALTPIRY